MPKHRKRTRRSIKHPSTFPSSNGLRPKPVIEHETVYIDSALHSFGYPAYLTPLKMYEMDLNGIKRKKFEGNFRTTYQVRQVSPDLTEALKSSLPNLRIVDKKAPTTNIDQSPSETSSSTKSSSTAPSDLSSVHGDIGIFTSQSYTPIKFEHIPGENDHMFGGGGPETLGHDYDTDCATVCSQNFVKQVTFMPFRILQIHDLELMRWLFKDPIRCCAELPEGFLITNYGLRRAFKESLAIGMHGEEWDLIMLGTLTRRGGILDDETARQKRVIYVEDMLSLIPEGHRLYDKDYWDALYAQGRLWSEMPDLDT